MISMKQDTKSALPDDSITIANYGEVPYGYSVYGEMN